MSKWAVPSLRGFRSRGGVCQGNHSHSRHTLCHHDWQQSQFVNYQSVSHFSCILSLILRSIHRISHRNIFTEPHLAWKNSQKTVQNWSSSRLPFFSTWDCRIVTLYLLQNALFKTMNAKIQSKIYGAFLVFFFYTKKLLLLRVCDLLLSDAMFCAKVLTTLRQALTQSSLPKC